MDIMNFEAVVFGYMIIALLYLLWFAALYPHGSAGAILFFSTIWPVSFVVLTTRWFWRAITSVWHTELKYTGRHTAGHHH
jgi:hypothetical protein